MKIPRKVKSIARRERRTLVERGLKLTEEVGELAVEIQRASGLKARKGRSTEQIVNAIHLEAVDVMLMAMDILVFTRASDRKITSIMAKQLKRWETSRL